MRRRSGCRRGAVEGRMTTAERIVVPSLLNLSDPWRYKQYLGKEEGFREEAQF